MTEATIRHEPAGAVAAGREPRVVRILFLTPRFPYPPLRGDQVRSYHQIRELARRHAVSLVSVTDRRVPAAARVHMASLCEQVSIRRLGVGRAIAGIGRLLRADGRPLQTLLYAAVGRDAVARLVAGGGFDLVHAQLVRTAGLLPPETGLPIVVDLVDAMSASYRRRQAIAPWWQRPALALEAARLASFEQVLLRTASACLVVSEAERRALGLEGTRATVNPNGVELQAFPFRPGSGAPARVVFIGNLGYPPNVDGVLWFASEILPRLRTRMPATEFIVVGPRAPRALRKLGRIPGITVAGFVPNVHEALTEAQVAVAPLRAGGGIQNKVLEAMAAGTPVVATTLAVGGIDVHDGEHCLVANTPAAFADAVALLFRRPELRLRLATAARARVVQQYSWEHSVAQLEGVYTAATEVHRQGDAVPPRPSMTPAVRSPA
jgi:sugar transferase (PEP-CTERM/EpsH1 system associated)